MKITRRQLRGIIREWFSDEHDPVTGKRDESEEEEPRNVVDATTGEIYADWTDPANQDGKPFSGMRADFEIWLAENPGSVESAPDPRMGIDDDFYVDWKTPHDEDDDPGSEWTEEDEQKYQSGRPWEHN